ncbi:MAG: sterol desaturase family protein, partial [Bdellovibrionaceae bacterium]|nr:sterol desaturase family protein [Pseudobdellovibrionaceae bacterium]
VKHEPISFGLFLKEIGSGIFILFVDATMTVVLLKAGLLNVKKNGSLVEFVTVFGLMFVWVEIYFYYSHRLLHHPKLFRIHRAHHQGAPLSPLTSLSFSLIERLILLFGAVVLPALLSLWVPLSAEAYMAYFFTNYSLNVLGHVNVEIFSPRFVNSWAGRFFYTPTFHALHHLRYKGHFGLFTSFLDKSHGTYFKDYPAFHENIMRQAEEENVTVHHGESAL